MKRPLPAHQKLVHKTVIKDIWDKGKNAVVVFGTRTYDEADLELAYNELTMVVRGAGGWGGERGPAGDANAPPDRAPDAVIEQKINADQALLYRLCGDRNPLHADPAFAQAFGFPKPHPPRAVHLRLRRAPRDQGLRRQRRAQASSRPFASASPTASSPARR